MRIEELIEEIRLGTLKEGTNIVGKYKGEHFKLKYEDGDLFFL